MLPANVKRELKPNQTEPNQSKVKTEQSNILDNEFIKLRIEIK